jgi:uncharacterized protein YkwD
LGGHLVRFFAFIAIAAAILAASPASALDINSYRRANGLPPVRANAALVRAASVHARDLAQRNQLDHSGFFTRMAGFRTAAENVAVGCANASCTYTMWVNSDGHRRNMLLPNIKRYGLASAKASNGARYWVLELSN